MRRFWRLGAACALLALAGQASAQPAGPPRPPQFPDAKVLGPVRAVDLKSLPDTAYSEFVAGPNSGFDSAWLVFTRVPAGGSGPPLHVHPADQFYFVLTGQMNAQLGDESFTADAGTLIMIPEGTPHRTWNTSNAAETHVELIVPPPTRADLVKPAQPRHIENAAGLVRKSKPFTGERSEIQWLANRETGSPRIGINLTRIPPGGRSPGLHIHTFDQAYFVIEGTMGVQIGLKSFEAGPNSYVVIPAGTVHRAWNAGKTPVKRLTLLLPEPPPGERRDIPVTIDASSSARSPQ